MSPTLQKLSLLSPPHPYRGAQLFPAGLMAFGNLVGTGRLSSSRSVNYSGARCASASLHTQELTRASNLQCSLRVRRRAAFRDRNQVLGDSVCTHHYG